MLQKICPKCGSQQIKTTNYISHRQYDMRCLNCDYVDSYRHFEYISQIQGEDNLKK